jgi:hypothetical protein
VHALLLLATIATTTLVGGLHYVAFLSDFGARQVPLSWDLFLPHGFWYSGTLLLILGAHEMGHYLACRYHRVDATLPYFLPAPIPLTGTIGAFIRIREAFPDTAFTVLARGRDLPNDILVARMGVDEAVFEAVRGAFVNQGAALMQAVLQGEDNRKYKGGFFLTSVEDADYDYVREMYRTIGIETFGEFVGD